MEPVLICSFCIAGDEFDFGLWTLQKAAEYNGLLQRLQGPLPPVEESLICRQFEAEYSTLRIVLASVILIRGFMPQLIGIQAWKEDKMDVADNLYVNLETLTTNLDTASVEKIVDTMFEIGKDLTLKNNSVLAAKWLERAEELINSQEMGNLSRDAIELRLAIAQALIQVYLDIGDPDYINRAENHIAYIQDKLGDKLVVLLFRTEVMLRSPAENFDSVAYADIVRRMMRTVDMSESTFKLLIHHIRQLDEKNHLVASSVIDEFLKTRVLTSQREQWIEKAVILRIYMAICDDSFESIKALEAVLDQVLLITGKPLSANTAAGIHTVCQGWDSELTIKLIFK